MSSSGGKKQSTTTSVSTNDPPAWSVPYYQDMMNRTQGVMDTPYQGYGGPTVAGFNDDQLNSFDMVRNQAGQNQGIQNQATGYLQNTIAGGNTNQYAGQNPYLDQMVNDSNRDITSAYTDSTVPNYLAQFQQGGAFGGSAMQQAMGGAQNTLGQNLARNTSNLRSADYDRQVGLDENRLSRQQNAIGMLPQLQSMGYKDATALGAIGGQQQGLYQQAIDDDRAAFTEERDWDKNNLGLLSNALGSIKGGTSSNAQTGANPNYRSGSENAASYAAILASLWG